MQYKIYKMYIRSQIIWANLNSQIFLHFKIKKSTLQLRKKKNVLRKI